VIERDDSLAVSATDSFERKGTDGAIVRIPAVLWQPDAEAAFWFDRGEITAKNPSDAAIVKMLELASRLNARVLGDDDEQYLPSLASPGYMVRKDAGESGDAPGGSSKPARPWWKFW
jgi:hypothetical protein